LIQNKKKTDITFTNTKQFFSLLGGEAINNVIDIQVSVSVSVHG